MSSGESYYKCILNLSPHTIAWVRFGSYESMVIVGKEYICVGSGCHIKFINVFTKEEFLYEVSTGEDGEGISTYAAHKSLSIMAFAEKCRQPTIFIKTCPDFSTICKLYKDSAEDYLAIAFSEGDYIITLNDMPSYSISIWNWRSDQKLAEVNCNFYSRNQILRCNFSSPINFAQIEVRSSKLNFWSVLLCGKKCFVTPRKIDPPKDSGPIVDILWTTEGTLFVLDKLGHVYTVNSESAMVRVIEWPKRGHNFAAFTWCKGGLLVSGPSGTIKHYKKSGNWICDWTISPPVPIKKIISNYKELLVCVSVNSHVLHYDFAKENFEYIKHHQAIFDDICMIYPKGEHFVTLQSSDTISSWEISTGTMLDSKTLKYEATAIKENPEYPYVGVGYKNGILELISLHNPSRIETMTSFNLLRKPLNSIYFTEIGKLIVAANTFTGQFFILEGIPGVHIQIIATVDAKQQVCDYILIPSRTCMRLFAILVTSQIYLAGDKIVRFCIDKNNPENLKKQYRLDNNFQMYTKMHTHARVKKGRAFFAVPMTTKSIHQLSTERNSDIATVTGILPTGHQMKNINIRINNYYTITYAYDGLVIVRSTKFAEKYAVIMPHFRAYGGVFRAFINPTGQYVVSLGRDNTLVCTRLENVPSDPEKLQSLEDFVSNPRLTLLFTRPTVGFEPTGELADKTWLEVMQIKQEEHDRLKCEAERKSILADFREIQVRVQELLTKNLEGPENELIDIQEFNLDVKLRDAKVDKNKFDCIETEDYLRALIVAQDRVCKWLTAYCWSPMEVHGQVICGIFSNFDVENYKLLPKSNNEFESVIEAYRAIETKMAERDSFQPWVPIARNRLLKESKIAPRLVAEEEKPVDVFELLEEEEQWEETEEVIDTDTEIALKGSIAHTIVEPYSGQYAQLEVASFAQTSFQNYLSLREVYKVKCRFNNQFDEMMAQKTREMNLVHERNARLRHILSELNYFSTNKTYLQIDDPPWSPRENPESIMKVEDKEVGVKPYVSPSEQEVLDAIAAEEERIRLLLLADDFRERALMAMMNGVLEVRWEDELKKDVPKPKCMLEKQAEDFNEDDLRTVREYEEAVKFLNSERERYKKMLEVEYGRVSNYVRDGIRKFNTKLSEFLLAKIKTDCSIRQENLRINRMRLMNAKRIDLNRKEVDIFRSLEMNGKECDSTHKLITSLQDVVQELRGNLENLVLKEKMLEKAFKKEFLEASPVVQEQTTKLYKRRPKVTMRVVTSITLTQEVAKCIACLERPTILTHDCLEFLKSLDALDLYVNVPPAVDEISYGIVCKHRRLKIESEIRIKAATMEISEAENTIASFQKLLHQTRDMHTKLLSDLEDVRTEKLNHFHNKEVQMVLRRGIVEIPTSGYISDFKDAVMVSRKDVETINKVILRGGNKKIKAMKETMNFRRGILTTEWEHKKLKMEIVDLETYITDIDSVKVTKEIQSYLKFKARGQSPDKGQSFEDEVQMVKASYEKIINDRKFKVNVLQQRINVIKRDNKNLDEKIANVNIDVCEYQQVHDAELDNRERNIIKTRMATLLKRSKLIKQIQQNHSDILMLQTELELLRLKTYPTLSYTILT